MKRLALGFTAARARRPRGERTASPSAALGTIPYLYIQPRRQCSQPYVHVPLERVGSGVLLGFVGGPKQSFRVRFNKLPVSRMV